MNFFGGDKDKNNENDKADEGGNGGDAGAAEANNALGEEKADVPDGKKVCNMPSGDYLVHVLV